MTWTGLSTVGFVVSCLVAAAGIVDALRFDDDAWARSGHRRSHWIVLQVVLGALGTVLYAATVRHDVADPDRDLGFAPGSELPPEAT